MNEYGQSSYMGRSPSPSKSSGHNLEKKINVLTKKFERVVCDVDPRHGNFDFICTESGSTCSKLVCMDCLKLAPEHF
jgi:hypothetical protein